MTAFFTETLIAEPLTSRRAWIWWLVFMLTSGALYTLATQWPSSPPFVVPVTAIDRAIGIVPSTLGLYLSYFLVLPSLIVLYRRQSWFIGVFFAGALAAGLCLLWHLVLPSVVPRPALGDSSQLTWLYAVDSPLAALPSGHVALPVAITLALWRKHPTAPGVYGVWTLLIAASTLTTGQHVFLDVMAGILVGIVSAGAVDWVVARGVDLRSLGALCLEWLAIAVMMMLALRLNHGGVYFVAVVVIATRQHGLLMLYHDAVHGRLCPDVKTNDLLINSLVGVPHLLAMEIYRPLHIAHHRHLGTERDPERRFLYAKQNWNYHPLAKRSLFCQLLGDLLFINAGKTYMEWRKHGGSLRCDRLTLVIAAVWVIAFAAGLALWPLTFCTVLLLWFLPLATLTNLLQKLRSYAEHSDGSNPVLNWNHLTYDWRVGALGRLTVWPYNINLHRQHHTDVNQPWHQLARNVGLEERTLGGARLVDLLCARKPR